MSATIIETLDSNINHYGEILFRAGFKENNDYFILIPFIFGGLLSTLSFLASLVALIDCGLQLMNEEPGKAIRSAELTTKLLFLSILATLGPIALIGIACYKYFKHDESHPSYVLGRTA